MNILSYNINQQNLSANPINNSNSNTKTSIFYVNDIHGQVPKMQRLVEASEQAEWAAKQNGADILKLCSGDTFIGSDEKRNQVAASFLNIGEFDAETLGNHEFDITASICGKLLKNSKAEILGANINFPDGKSDLSDKVVRSCIKEGKNGDKYGLIGIQPPDMMSRLKKKDGMEGITIDDEEQTLNEIKEEVKKLQDENINKIILVSHGGNGFEKEIARTIDGIDVILGGHSHDLIEGITPGENLFYSPKGEPVVITQAGRDGNNYGILNLEFDKNGYITSVQNNIHETNIHSPNLMMQKTADSILGESPIAGTLKYADPIPKNNLLEENAWADFVGDALINRLDADICLINSANFRGSVDQGTVTERDITSIFPFNNKLFKVKINEEDLVNAIKLAGQSMVKDNHKPGLLQVAGLSYTVDKQGTLSELVYIDKNNQKHNIDVNNPDKNKTYTAIYDEFLINGGDNMEMLKKEDSEIIEKYDYDKEKVTIDYIKTLEQPFEVRKDNRIKILS